MQRRLDPETGVNKHKHCENVSCQGRNLIRIFFTEGAAIFVTFSSVVFSAELILSNLSTKNDSKGSGGMLPQKF